MTTPRGAAPVLILIHEAVAPPEHPERPCCMSRDDVAISAAAGEGIPGAEGPALHPADQPRDLPVPAGTVSGVCRGQTTRLPRVGFPEEFESSSGLETRTQFLNLRDVWLPVAKQECTEALNLDGRRVKTLYRRAQVRGRDARGLVGEEEGE